VLPAFDNWPLGSVLAIPSNDPAIHPSPQKSFAIAVVSHKPRSGHFHGIP
jgi:hypothetical protein